MKKVLSIILAAAMAFSLIPAAFAEGEVVTFEGYEYVFNTSAVNVDANENLSLNDDGKLLVDDMAAMTLDDIDAERSARWRPASHNYMTHEIAVDNTRIYWRSTRNPAELLVCFAIELEVKNGGVYIPSMEIRKKTNAPIVDVYLVKEGTTSNGKSTSDFNFPSEYGSSSSKRDGDLWTFVGGDLSSDMKRPEEHKLGQVDMWASSNADYTLVSFDKTITLDDNSKYYLIFHTVGKNDDCEADDRSRYDVQINSFKLTYASDGANDAFDYKEETYETSDSTTVSRLAYYGSTTEALGEPETVTYGDSYDVPAVQRTIIKDNKTYNFNYWAKGMQTKDNKLILSTDTSFAYMPQEGANYLIAVYEEVGAEKQEAFYNYNGQLLTGLKIDENNRLPELPSMAGFDEPASKWVQLGTNVEFDAGADVSEISGDKVFMAKYGEKKSNIRVTVDGVQRTYAYGDKVTCKLPSDKTEEQVFMYWTKTVDGAEIAEIVSTEEDYSFYAWENCEVTSVYGYEKPTLAKTMRKIIISSVAAGDETAIMAEFIGFDDALEKGIMIGGRKIAMSTNNSQFTITNNISATSASGYAIIKDGETVTEITDGSITLD